MSTCYDTKRKQVVVFYQDGNDSDYGKLKTISIAANGTPTWGTYTYTWKSSAVTHIGAAYFAAQSRPMVGHRNANYAQFDSVSYNTGTSTYTHQHNLNTYNSAEHARPKYSTFHKRLATVYYQSGSYPKIRTINMDSSGNLSTAGDQNLLANETSTSDTTQWSRPVVAINDVSGKATAIFQRSSSYIKYKHAAFTSGYWVPDSGAARNGRNSATGNDLTQYGHRLIFHPTGTAGTTDRGDGGHMLYVQLGNATGTSNNQTSSAYPITQHIDNNHMQYIGLAQNTAAAGEVVYVKTYGMIDSNQRSVSYASQDSQTGWGRATYPFRVFWNKSGNDLTTSDSMNSSGQNQMAGIQLSPEKMMVIFSTGADYDGGTNSYDNIRDSLSGPRS